MSAENALLRRSRSHAISVEMKVTLLATALKLLLPVIQAAAGAVLVAARIVVAETPTVAGTPTEVVLVVNAIAAEVRVT